MSALCGACAEAVELDQVAIVRLDDAEIAVIACPEHMPRVVLAIETLSALERSIGDRVPPLAGVVLAQRVVVSPERRS